MKSKKNNKKKIEPKNIKKWIIITTVIILVSVMLVMLIFRNKIFNNNVIGQYFKLTELAEYKENVKERKIERIGIISANTNYEATEKKDIKKILEFIHSMEGSVIKDEVASAVSNTYGIVLYYKDNTNTIITIGPNEFAVADSAYYKNKSTYYGLLQELLKELM